MSALTIALRLEKMGAVGQYALRLSGWTITCTLNRYYMPGLKLLSRRLGCVLSLFPLLAHHMYLNWASFQLYWL